MKSESKYLILSIVLIILTIIISLLGGIDSINNGVLIPVALFISYWLISITNLVPFSVMEIGTIVLFIYFSIKFIRLIYSKKFKLKIYFIKFILFCSVIIFVYMISFGIFNRNHTFNEYKKSVTDEQVYTTALKLAELCNKYVNYEEKNFFETARDVAAAFENSDNKLFDNIVPRPKGSLFSSLMSYSYISGIYVPFTGETLINKKIPSYTIPFTMAHETAHSMSIAREDEATFAAFYVLINNGSDNLKFSAAAECLSYFLDTLYENDKELYNEVLSKLDYKVIEKYKELGNYLKRYDTVTKDISQKVNDTYLKSSGQESGISAYGEVVILLTNYFEHF